MSGVIIDLDWSFVIQLAIVLVLMVLLKQLIFDPYLKTLGERDRRIGDVRRDALALRQRADDLADRYGKGQREAREAAYAARQALRIEGGSEKVALVTEARGEAGRSVESTRAQVETEVGEARARLLSQVDDLARLVVEKVLGRGV